MERSERIRLEAIRRQLKQNLSAVEELLKVAESPRRLSDADIKKRVLAICREMHGIRIVGDTLRERVTRHGMPYQAVGALFAGGYLKRTKRGIVLGPRGRSLVRKSPAAHR